MKLRKKKKKEKNYKLNIKKALLILVMLISIIIAMITYWIYAYHHKYGKLYFDDIKLVSYKISDYLDVKGDIVYLKNMDSDIIDTFTIKQQNIISNNNVVSVDIVKELYKNILSVMINYTIYDGNKNSDEIVTINIDLKNDVILDNEQILKMINMEYKQIAKDIFDENIKLPSDSGRIVVDSITDKKLTVSEFNGNSEKYIIRIREKLPDIINFYIKDNKLYYIIDLKEIYKVCYYTNESKLVNINKELAQI